MKNRFSALLSIGVVCVSATSFTAAPSRSIPVVSSFAGSGDEPHAIRSDGGPYYHNVKGTSGVESHIQEGGAYELDVYYFTSERKLSFDLDNLVSGTGTPTSPSGVVVTKGRLITKCSSTQNLLNMDPSQPLDSALHGRFDYYGRTMLVRMGGAEAPGTKNVRVAWTGTNPANPSQCQNWRLQTSSGVK